MNIPRVTPHPSAPPMVPKKRPPNLQIPHQLPPSVPFSPPPAPLPSSPPPPPQYIVAGSGYNHQPPLPSSVPSNAIYVIPQGSESRKGSASCALCAGRICARVITIIIVAGGIIFAAIIVRFLIWYIRS